MYKLAHVFRAYNLFKALAYTTFDRLCAVFLYNISSLIKFYDVSNNHCIDDCYKFLVIVISTPCGAKANILKPNLNYSTEL